MPGGMYDWAILFLGGINTGFTYNKMISLVACFVDISPQFAFQMALELATYWRSVKVVKLF
jgi:hypothetical protein